MGADSHKVRVFLKYMSPCCSLFPILDRVRQPFCSVCPRAKQDAKVGQFWIGQVIFQILHYYNLRKWDRLRVYESHEAKSDFRLMSNNHVGKRANTMP